MKTGSAAKLIVDALLQRFLPLARRRIETAQAQVSILAWFSHLHFVNLLLLVHILEIISGRIASVRFLC